MLDKIINKNIINGLSETVRKNWNILYQLGEAGKDGIIYATKHKITGQEGAIKIFKKRKSLKKIIKEKEFYDKCSEVGICPKIISEFEINEENKCFIMERLDKTLRDIVIEQKKTLTDTQVERLKYLYKKLSEIKILHNDCNVFRNIMSNKDGKLYLIDFGFSKLINNKRIKERGPYSNYSLLLEIDYALKQQYFKDLIIDYQKKYNVFFSYSDYYEN